ncbi:hypothetical protein Tco_0427765 [Tanacetum coccineum]
MLLFRCYLDFWGLLQMVPEPRSFINYLISTRATEIEKDGARASGLGTLKGDDIEAYSNRFHELVLMCPELMPTESKKIGKYIRGFLVCA